MIKRIEKIEKGTKNKKLAKRKTKVIRTQMESMLITVAKKLQNFLIQTNSITVGVIKRFQRSDKLLKLPSARPSIIKKLMELAYLWGIPLNKKKSKPKKVDPKARERHP